MNWWEDQRTWSLNTFWRRHFYCMEIKKVWSVNCLLCWKTKWRRFPLGWGIELYGSSSCLWGLRSLLNTEVILTLSMFLLSDGSLIQIWSASFAQWCRVLLSLSIIVKSLSSAFGCLWRCGGFWWHWWSDFCGLKLFLSGTCWFHLCIQLCSCWLGISSGRLYQSSVYLEFDLLDAWVKTWWCWYL